MRVTIKSLSKLQAALAALLSLFAISAEGATQTTEITAASVQRVTLDRNFPVEGTVEAVHRATMTAKTSGTISELNFDVNDYVVEGQVLLRFQGKQNRAERVKAQAGLDEARARLMEAENEYDRLNRLYQKKMMTESQMDQIRSGVKSAKARVKAAEARLSSASEGVSDTVVKAPYSGYVTERFVQLGESANMGQPLFTGISLDELRVLTHIPQKYVTAVRSHNEAQVSMERLGAQPRRIAVEKITIFPVADQQSHTVGVRLMLPKGVGGIYPGLLVRADYKIGEREALLIPEASVVRRSELTAVYVLSAKASHPILRMVRLGEQQENGMVEVVSGLKEGEQIALDTAKAVRASLNHYAEMKQQGVSDE